LDADHPGNLESFARCFTGKQVSSFWSAIFSTGRTPQGMQVLPKPINLNGMIVPKGVE